MTRRLAVVLLLGLAAAGCSQAAERPVAVSPVDVAQEAVRDAAGADYGGGAVVWGGRTGELDAARPVGDGWILPGGGTPMRTAPAPIAARSRHVVAAHGGLVHVWGGGDGRGTVFDDGAVLDPRTNTWTAMPRGPVGLTGAQAVVVGDRIVIGGGASELIVVYDTRERAWTTIDARAQVLAFAVSAGRVVAATRGPDRQTLHVGRYGWDGPGEPEFATLRQERPISDSVAIADDGTTVTLAVADDATTTTVYRLDATGRPRETATVDAGVFVPGQGAAAGLGRTFRHGGDWLTIDSYSVSGFSIDARTASGRWRLDVCRDGAAWVPLGGGGRRFLRYGGRPCGGDVPEDTGPVLAVVELQA
ncbi:hypothetical protein ABZS66_20440 [Dactylosporangium sp. NPDC005572]|uniref:hypothetical protein n=1 Tax=Dactylosporangium sp. NPDC005572 TaxID=3156889 RepID=UPI0033BBBA9D